MSAAAQKCRKVSFAAEVGAGQEYRHAISARQAFLLKPVANGWRIEVVPATTTTAVSRHDAAEVATPPYQSVSPLLLTTDYKFRAQDVVSWNPREFQFATNLEHIEQASADEDILFDKSADAAKRSQAEQRLIALASSSAPDSARGQLQILAASLVPGTADQVPAAAAVASHWRTTPHTLVQPHAGAAASPLGTVESLRFAVSLWIPAAGANASACPR